MVVRSECGSERQQGAKKRASAWEEEEEEEEREVGLPDETPTPGGSPPLFLFSRG